MKNNFHAMRRWYRLERKPIPESEPKDFMGHILLTADDASAFIFIFFIINVIQAIYLRYEHHDVKHPAVAFVIFLVILPFIIYFNNNQHLKTLTLVKLIFLNYKVKMSLSISIRKNQTN